jgi:hypothetical protein
MQAGLADSDCHVSLPRGWESNRPPEFLESPLSIDRRGDADRSRPYDRRATSFRFYVIDRNCQLSDINEGRIDRDRNRKRIVERKLVPA